MLKVGIVGLPNVGKSTLFNALLKKEAAQAANYPFTTIDPNVGVIEVSDQRLGKLAKTVNTQKIVPATVEFVDIAGLVKDAHKGEGLGNRFLSHIREVDAIAHVVRVFEDSSVIRSGADPKSDIETINIELMLADLETINKLIEAKTKEAKTSKDAKEELLVLEKIREGLEKEQLAKNIQRNEKYTDFASRLPLITNKPMIYVFNVSENDLANLNPEIKALSQQFQPSVYLCAKIESDLSTLSPSDQKEYLKNLGVEESGLEKLIRASYKLLGLITYFTAGEKEVRAWTIKGGTNARKAAGVIHTDFEKGFIKAQVIDWNVLVGTGGWKHASEKGLARFEGRDYAVKDGDVIDFKFSN